MMYTPEKIAEVLERAKRRLVEDHAAITEQREALGPVRLAERRMLIEIIEQLQELVAS